MNWTINRPEKEGFYWEVDLANPKETPHLVEIKEVCGKLAGRYINSISWSCVDDWEDFAFYGPIEPPEYK
jgi:hypothetical protein